MSLTGSAELRTGGEPGPVVAVCWKRVEARASVDPLTGVVRRDPHSAGPSVADEAALEWALRMAEAWDGSVLAVSAGARTADQMLRAAIAAGASRAVVVPLDETAPSHVVAAALAGVVRSARVICCGDASVDRGSGSVPAFLAAQLAAPQALGLVHIDQPVEGDRRIVADRRLDRGRRERLALRLDSAAGTPSAVISVEGGSARLRRASLGGVLSARHSTIEIVEPPAVTHELAVGAGVRVAGVGPYRPRTRVVPPPPGSLPARERIQLLTGTIADRPGPRTFRLEPLDAAALALEALANWGELPWGPASRPPPGWGELP